MGGDEDHRIDVVGWRIETSREAAISLIRLIIIPTRESGRQPKNNILVIRWNQVTGRIHNQRAVRPDAIQADRKQLHDLAGIVLVGMRSGDDAALVIALHVEVETHGRSERYALEQITEIPKCIVEQLVVIRSEDYSIILKWSLIRDHHDFAQGKRCSLAQLIG